MKPRSDYDIVKELLHDMSIDNGCTFVPCSFHFDEIIMAVNACRKDGLKFTAHQVGCIAYGEEREQQRVLKLSKNGGERLNKAMNQIFDGCKDCYNARVKVGGTL